MIDRRQVLVGATLILLGLFFLAGYWLNINVWALLGPLLLILLGIWLILRPRRSLPGTRWTQKLIGDLRRRGNWQVVDEEITLLLGDIHFDLREATIASGTTRLRFSGFIFDLKLRIPAGVGVTLAAAGVVSSVNFLGQKHERFLGPLQLTHKGDTSAARHIQLEIAAFIANVHVEVS